MKKVYNDLRNYLANNLNLYSDMFRVEQIKHREEIAFLVSLQDESLANLKGFPILWDGKAVWTKRLIK